MTIEELRREELAAWTAYQKNKEAAYELYLAVTGISITALNEQWANVHRRLQAAITEEVCK